MRALFTNFVLLFQEHGEVSEWLKEHAWKVCIPLKGIEGSNPSLSAKHGPTQVGPFLCAKAPPCLHEQVRLAHKKAASDEGGCGA